MSPKWTLFESVANLGFEHVNIAAYKFGSASNVPRGPLNILVVNRLHIESC